MCNLEIKYLCLRIFVIRGVPVHVDTMSAKLEIVQALQLLFKTLYSVKTQIKSQLITITKLYLHVFIRSSIPGVLD